MCPAAAPAAFSPCASVAPAASAAAFLAAPASSTPIGSLDCSQTTPARVKTAPSERRELLARSRRRRAPAPSWTISCACAGPPMQATRSAPKRSLSTTVGGRPCGGTSPLATDTTAVRLPRPASGERGDHLAERARGDREEDVVGARDARRRRASMRSCGRQLDAGQVARVLVPALDLARPARRCASAASCAGRRARAARRAPCRTIRRR